MHRLWRWLCLLSFGFLLSSTTSSNDDITAVAFYNMYVGPDEKTGIDYYPQILEEQLGVMRSTGLLDRLSKVYYATVGEDKGENFIIEEEKFEHLKHHGHHADETQTLGLLYDYCNVNPQHYVLYFHNKGSFHYGQQNSDFRRALDCFVLNPNCLEVLDTYDTCGFRATLIPYIHYSGNFWWATCQYINKLVPPLSPMTNQTFIDLTATLHFCTGTHERYFAENWIGSHPDINPADCLSADEDTGFTYGYFFFPNQAINKQCEENQHMSEENQHMSHDKSYQYVPGEEPGEEQEQEPLTPPKKKKKCGKGSMFESTEFFRQAADNIYALTPNDCKIDLSPDLVRRSEYWYGQPPRTYLNAIDRLYVLPNVTELEGSAVKINRLRDVYLIKDGLLHAIPSVSAFMRLGFDDFDQVKTLREHEFNSIPRGDDIPP